MKVTFYLLQQSIAVSKGKKYTLNIAVTSAQKI